MSKTTTVDVAWLAKHCNITAMRVQQLAKDGIMVRVDRGRYDVLRSLLGYVAYLQKGQRNSRETNEEADLEKERTRLTRIKADQAQIELDMTQGKVHDAEIVAEVMNEMLANFRARTLAIPAACAGQLADATDPNTCKDILTDAVHDALNELADYDSSRTTERFVLRNREDGETASEVDDQRMG